VRTYFSQVLHVQLSFLGWLPLRSPKVISRKNVLLIQCLVLMANRIHGVCLCSWK
jgi:hypothetical protein